MAEGFILREADSSPRPTRKRSSRDDNKAKKWCLTLNNYDEEQFLEAEAFAISFCTYGIIGEEVGESGTPHLQMFFHTKKPERFSAIKKHFPSAHIERGKGGCYQNFQYCSKDGKFHEYGQRPAMPKSIGKDWKTMLVSAMAGHWDRIEPGDLVQHGGKLQKACELMRAAEEHKPRHKLHNILYSGPTGVGKSCVLTLFPGLVYAKPEGKWWPNYRGQPIVYWEDVEPEDFTGQARMWKRLLDHYVQQTESKGGHVYSTPKVVYLTSNYTFEELTEKLRKQDVPALRRRLKCYNWSGCKDRVEEGKPYHHIIRHLIENPVSMYHIIRKCLEEYDVIVPELPARETYVFEENPN